MYYSSDLLIFCVLAAFAGKWLCRLNNSKQLESKKMYNNRKIQRSRNHEDSGDSVDVKLHQTTSSYMYMILYL